MATRPPLPFYLAPLAWRYGYHELIGNLPALPRPLCLLLPRLAKAAWTSNTLLARARLVGQFGCWLLVTYVYSLRLVPRIHAPQRSPNRTVLREQGAS